MKFFSTLLMFLCFLSISSTPVLAQDINAIASGQSATINKHGTCRIVTNNGGPTTMVQHRSAAEWNSFIANRPGHMSLTGCTITERDPTSGDYFVQLHNGPAIRWMITGVPGSYQRAVHWQGYFYGNQCCYSTLAQAKAPIERDGWMLYPGSARVGSESSLTNPSYDDDNGNYYNGIAQYGIYRTRTYTP